MTVYSYHVGEYVEFRNRLPTTWGRTSWHQCISRHEKNTRKSSISVPEGGFLHEESDGTKYVFSPKMSSFADLYEAKYGCKERITFEDLYKEKYCCTQKSRYRYSE